MFSRYAIREVIGGAIVGIGLTAWAGIALPAGACLLPAGLLAAWLWFFRDPPRRMPTDAAALYAPADGRIVSIQREPLADDSRNADRIVITIFLSVFDVHVQRSPITGAVSSRTHRPGRYRSALSDRSSHDNECLTLTIEPDQPSSFSDVRVRQIAGLIARRIVCCANPGDRLAAGQRYGMIKLGSRVELTVRVATHIAVGVVAGQRVRAGETVLLRA